MLNTPTLYTTHQPLGYKVRHMTHKRSTILMLALLAIVCVATLTWGRNVDDLSFDFWSLDFVLDLRLPRLVTAAVCGASVALAGCLSQNLFRNVLASPSILGTEAGTSFAIGVIFYFWGAYLDSRLVMVSGFLGGTIVTLFTVRFAAKDDSMTKLLLAGFALNAFLGSLTSLILGQLMESGQGTDLYRWLMGSFVAKDWNQCLAVCSTFAFGLVVVLRIASPLDSLWLGDDVAKINGLPVRFMRMASVAIICLLTAGAIGVGGVLPFVSLIVPHYMRLKHGGSMRSLAMNCCLGGALLTTTADLLAKHSFYPVETSVGILTTLIGAPYFIWLLMKRAQL
ncbi:MAG: iron ABC transporter permease [Proteobacteria bacterium]|nr:iron ABC transporter permease [Pseudomonadota bacterium]